jgi:hypothetical protein
MLFLDMVCLTVGLAWREELARGVDAAARGRGDQVRDGVEFLRFRSGI